MRYTAAPCVSSYGKRLASSRTSHDADRYAARRRKTLAAVLNDGGIAVIPTDTLYGIVARALDKKAVGRLYSLRRETPKKPFIILLASLKETAAFGIRPNAAQKRFLKTVWPGKVSVIFQCKAKRFSYLHLGTKSLAFRVPKPNNLREFLKKTGPLAAPSANPEGEKPAETIAEAKKYFGDKAEVYLSARRRVRSKPSTVVSLLGPTPKMLRQGSVKISV